VCVCVCVRARVFVRAVEGGGFGRAWPLAVACSVYPYRTLKQSKMGIVCLPALKIKTLVF